ncbi:SIS domain-containing protein [Frigidibacter sp. ROC022]|uniref:SIS domain-containing protein n=1 Tax=Frigidibacter sp. ROC022 TaxID=2971796 RepID=UPI00215A4833|nr:SIS domain-containing protein [Frigidibacter sp. ROC022]MCR8724394.1 SIS domain-containing protein [Frigidibacter sp. ROC022]
MSGSQSLMLSEAGESPQVIARLLERAGPQWAQLAEAIRTRGISLISTAARGSSDHAATVFKYLMEIETGLPVVSIGPSIASVYKRPLKLGNAMHITVSQSGASPDILAMQAAAKAGGALTVAVVNVEDSPVAQAADVVLALGAGPERSVAATKSFIASVVALAGIAAAASGDDQLMQGLKRLPEALSATEGLDFQPALRLLAETRSFYIGARGPGYGIALEAALKGKEVAGLHAEAFSLAELIHGPLQLVGAGFPVLAFLPDDPGLSGNLATLKRVQALGAQTIALSSVEVPGLAMRLPGTGCGLIDPLVGLLVYYRLIEGVARAKGLDPDHPEKLSKVTETL